jgi:plastocyanin
MRLHGAHAGRLKAALLCAALVALGAAGFALAGRTTLSLTSGGPDPETATVPWGATVVITNEDSVPHSLASSHSELQTPSIQPHQTYTTTFTTKSRAYSYRQLGGKAGFSGKVVVDFSGSVSLRASRAVVDLGRTVRLSGTTTIHDTPVAIEVRRGANLPWTLLATPTSDGRGAFAATLRLDRGGKVRATVAAGQIRSLTAVVSVRPRLTAVRSGHTVRGRVVPARAAVRLTLECSSHGHWKRAASRRPGADGVVAFAARGGRSGRIAVEHADAVDGYAPVVSRAVSAAC